MVGWTKGSNCLWLLFSVLSLKRLLPTLQTADCPTENPKTSSEAKTIWGDGRGRGAMLREERNSPKRQFIFETTGHLPEKAYFKVKKMFTSNTIVEFFPTPSWRKPLQY